MDLYTYEALSLIYATVIALNYATKSSYDMKKIPSYFVPLLNPILCNSEGETEFQLGSLSHHLPFDYPLPQGFLI